MDKERWVRLRENKEKYKIHLEKHRIECKKWRKKNPNYHKGWRKRNPNYDRDLFRKDKLNEMEKV